MEKNIKISIGILLALAMSRFIPHPPNFTSLIALSFYIPVIFGLRYLPALLISFAITDFIIGFHNTVFYMGKRNINSFNFTVFQRHNIKKNFWSAHRCSNFFHYNKFWSLVWWYVFSKYKRAYRDPTLWACHFLDIVLFRRSYFQQ